MPSNARLPVYISQRVMPKAYTSAALDTRPSSRISAQERRKRGRGAPRVRGEAVGEARGEAVSEAVGDARQRTVLSTRACHQVLPAQQPAHACASMTSTCLRARVCRTPGAMWLSVPWKT